MSGISVAASQVGRGATQPTSDICLGQMPGGEKGLTSVKCILDFSQPQWSSFELLLVAPTSRVPLLSLIGNIPSRNNTEFASLRVFFAR